MNRQKQKKQKGDRAKSSLPKDVPKITSVWRATWYLAGKRYLLLTVLIVGGSLFTLSFHPLLPVFFVAIYISILFTTAQSWFMRQFAQANNFSYKKTLPLDTVHGRLFNVGHSRTISNAVIGSYKNHPLKIFNYSYTVGSGKHKRRYAFTVSEIAFGQTQFPHILLRSRTMSRYGSFNFFGDDKDVQITLEEAFSDNFKLYCTQDYEIEVLQIFTSGFLTFLESTAADFSIEFADNCMYIFDDRVISTKRDLDEMFRVVQQIFDKRGALLNRLHDDFKVLHDTYKK